MQIPTINVPFLIGAVGLFLIIFIIQIASKKLIGINLEGEEAEEAVKLRSAVFKNVYLLAIVGVIIAFMFIGFHFPPDGRHEAGQLNTSGVGTIKYVAPKNDPETKSKEIKKDQEEGQKESQKSMDDFRKNMGLK